MLVKVWNDNVHPFSQKIGTTEYKIPAKEYIEIDQEDANKLIKSYSPIEVDYDGNALPTSYKKLRIDEKDLEKIRRMAEAKGKSGSYLCQACGYVASSKWELSGHLQDMHRDSWEDPEEAMAGLKKEKTKKKA